MPMKKTKYTKKGKAGKNAMLPQGKKVQGEADGLNDKTLAEFLRHHQEIKNNPSQLKNIRLIKCCAEQARLILKNFQTNKSLELYFDIYRDTKNICYISKGWRDPGFRIGAFAEIHQGIADFKERLNYIEKICSRDFISFDYHTKQGNGNVSISLEIAVYRSGFNEKALKEVVEILVEDLKSIKLVSSGLIPSLSQTFSC